MTAPAPERATTGWPDRFSVDPGYLNAATLGAPPRATSAALRAALLEWEGGHACAARYDASVQRARALYASLVGTDPDLVAVGSQVSVMAGLVAASLPEGAEVVCIADDFTSMGFPFLVHAQRRDVRVRQVPLAALAESIGPATTLVAYSLVQSADGALVDHPAVLEAAARHGARTFVDTTQAVGWLPFDASGVDYSVCAGYKWLCHPRGTAFLTVRRGLVGSLPPLAAGWYAGEDVWSSCYGPGMELAGSARRYDVSPAWLSWVGAVPALELVLELGVEHLGRHGVALADALRDALGLAPSRSAVVALRPPVVGADAQQRLEAAGLRVSARAGNVRLAFHAWNTADDVDRVLRALGAPAAARG